MITRRYSRPIIGNGNYHGRPFGFYNHLDPPGTPIMMLDRVSDQCGEETVQVLFVNADKIAPKVVVNLKTPWQPDFLYRGIKGLPKLNLRHIAALPAREY